MRYEKLSPDLAAAVEDYSRQGRQGLDVHRRTLGLVSVDPAPKPARVVLFLHTEGDADLSRLADLGVEINGGDGSVRTGIAPIESLDQITEDPSVGRIEPARRLRLLLDKAVPAVGVPALRQASGLSGQGVVVGIVDTGIESGHDSFAGRIDRVWDQTLNGKGVPEGGYGVELIGPTMGQSRDTHGHGTHVAGIAAGADATFEGVAPGATLIMVKSDLLDAHIADGIRYVFRVASDLGMPAVVNLSLGGHADAHDGTDSLSKVIDEAVGPGRIVCCAAGNEGNFNIHAQVLARHDRTRTIACAIPTRSASTPAFVAAFNGWYSGADRLAVSVVSPSEEATPFQAVATGNANPVQDYQLPDGAARIITPGADAANGDHNFYVLIEPGPQSPPPAGTPPAQRNPWRIRLRGDTVTDGRVDVWSVVPQTGQFAGRTVVDDMKVGSPGASSGAITVASYTTKVEWEDVFGGPHSTGLELDDISDFSSEGPRRDGAEKPDVAAPGAMIVSAMSVHSGVAPEQLVDDRHRVMAGTSMASPFVAGLVALLLEQDPKLDPESARTTLRNCAAIPGQPAGTFDPKWGYGLIDASRLQEDSRA